MLLVDTSVWIDHFRYGNSDLELLLEDGRVMCHPFIIGELACGNLKNRSEIISLIQTLPCVMRAEHKEVMPFIENHRLMGKGLGYVDMNLLASAILTGVPLWTLDKKLTAESTRLGICFNGR
jgi:predicted nucleic acid-binding protein